VFPPSQLDLSELLAALAVTILAMSYVVSSLEGRVELRIPRGDLETAGLLLGTVYLVYALALISARVIV
jgi:hypothetical protein